MKLSVYLITFNEEQRLPRTLEQASKIADEIVLVDSGSSDNTIGIAHQYGAKVIEHAWHSYCDQKHFAETQCSNDYVLMLDADEVLSDSLVKEINELKSSQHLKKAYSVKIANMFPFDKKPSRFAARFNVVRLYDKTVCSVPADKQNKDRVYVPHNIQTGQLKNDIYHYSLMTLEQSIDKYNKHSSELQRMMAQKNRRVSAFRLYMEFPYQFLRYYFCHKYFLMGNKGFSQAMVLAIFRWLKVAKAYEAQCIEKNKKN